MKRFFRSFSVLLICLLFSAMPAWAAIDPPAKPAANIYVQDLAGIISTETQSQILSLGKEMDQKTTAQVVVVTVPDLNGNSIEDYALALFRSWGIGNKEKNNGVLILVAPNEQQSRIEVGYGLEGALPDGKTGRIQDENMIPYFQSGDYSSGIYQCYLAVMQVVAGEYGVTLKGDLNPEPAPSVQAPTRLPTWAVVLIAIGIFFLIFLDFKFFGGMITFWLLASFRRGGGGGGGGGGFGGGSSGGGGSSRNW